VCYHVYGWRQLVKATEVIESLPESNGSLLPDGWLKVTRGLTACTSGSAPDPTLGNEYMGELYLFNLREWQHFLLTGVHNGLTCRAWSAGYLSCDQVTCMLATARSLVVVMLLLLLLFLVVLICLRRTI